jgi:hypothetical protein
MDITCLNIGYPNYKPYNIYMPMKGNNITLLVRKKENRALSLPKHATSEPKEACEIHIYFSY